jgi:hypothetical protein
MIVQLYQAAVRCFHGIADASTLYVPNMKILYTWLLPAIAFSSCGQSNPSGKEQTTDKRTSQEALLVYKNLRNEVCNCTMSTMRNNKPSTVLDSCYALVLPKYTDTLKALGYDPAQPAGENKLHNELRLRQCEELYSLLEKEWADEDAGKLLFKGQFVAQKILPTGEHEITLMDGKTKEQKVFKSKRPFNEAHVSDYLPGYELTIEYEIIKNTKTQKDELYIKEGGTVSVIGPMPVKK